MDLSRRPRSVRAIKVRRGNPSSTGGIFPKASVRAQAEVLKIPAGVLDQIESQRSELITLITLLHCLHVALEQKQDNIDVVPNPRIEAAVSCASLSEVTAILLERTHAVLYALDSVNLTNA
jgi:hypothetical protein